MSSYNGLYKKIGIGILPAMVVYMIGNQQLSLASPVNPDALPTTSIEQMVNDTGKIPTRIKVSPLMDGSYGKLELEAIIGEKFSYDLNNFTGLDGVKYKIISPILDIKDGVISFRPDKYDESVHSIRVIIYEGKDNESKIIGHFLLKLRVKEKERTD